MSSDVLTLEVFSVHQERNNIRSEAASKPPHFVYKDRNMKNFRVTIHFNGYYADFNLMAEDSRESIEKSILDKLGQNAVKFEKNGFTSKKGKWITYEEVSNDRRPIHYESVLGTRVATGAPEGR